VDFDLHRLVQEVKSMLGAKAGEKALSFTLELGPDLPRYVNADQGKLRQILINLVGKAVKFTEGVA
jgi:two-component system sensor histidine kinase/response regulator